MPLDTELSAADGALIEIAGATRAEAVAVPVHAGPDGPTPGSGFAELAGHLPAPPERLLSHYSLTGEPGEIAELPADLGYGLTRVLLVGVGERAAADLRRAGATLARRVRKRASLVTSLGSAAPPAAAQALAEGLLLAGYHFTRTGSGSPPVALRTIRLAGGDPARLEAPLARARAVAAAVALARDLGNTPADTKSPAWLADQAVEAGGRAGLQVRVRDEVELAAAGFGGILAVGAGSARPPRLIELTYRPADGQEAGHVVLAGKGITFDSGGLSLKPLEGMKLMKTDMSGGGVVIAVLTALAELGVRARVTGLVAAAENMPSGSAMRPGDVITHYGGRTVEVLNTDAEGRLVLADALAYAAAELDPDVVVDVATLTGAARVALGVTIGAMYSTSDDLATGLLAASEASGEQLWRMPLTDEYRDALDSTVADIAHISRKGRYGNPGSIEAALFLREFAGGRSWAHLDIAGPSRAAADQAEVSRGATGFGARLLLEWLSGYPHTRRH